MKFVLIKYKEIKLLINEDCNMQPLIEHIQSIETLNEKVKQFYMNLMNVTKRESLELEKEQQQLMSKIGYKITGMPFTNQDAELYALDKKLEYTELELV